MGNFKRYDGYVMHIPQEFIDSKLPVCPFCKSNNPHWLLDSRLEMSLAGSRTYYQCERCHATISSTAADAGSEKGKSFAINPGMAAMNAAQKGIKKQEVGVAYMRVEELGAVCTDASMLGQEYPITYLQNMIVPQKSFCTNCGAEITGDALFCSACGNKRANAPVADPAPAPVTAPAPQAAPVYQAPVAAPVAAPVVEAPATAYKFPLAPLILIGIAALVATIKLFSYTYSFLSIVTNLLNIAPYVLLVVGLLTCKKERNVLFGAGFLAMAGLGFFSFIGDMVNYIEYGSYMREDMLLLIMLEQFQIFTLIPIGISYLAAKPAMGKLKLIFSIVYLSVGFLSLLFFLSGFDAANAAFKFLFESVALAVGTILYTPFKKC